MITLHLDDADLDALAARIAERIAAHQQPAPSTSTPNQPEWLTTKDAALYLQVTKKTLTGWRSKGTGPRARRVGTRSVRYSRTELDSWMRRNPKEEA